MPLAAVPQSSDLGYTDRLLDHLSQRASGLVERLRGFQLETIASSFLESCVRPGEDPEIRALRTRQRGAREKIRSAEQCRKAFLAAAEKYRRYREIAPEFARDTFLQQYSVQMTLDEVLKNEAEILGWPKRAANGSLSWPEGRRLKYELRGADRWGRGSKVYYLCFLEEYFKQRTNGQFFLGPSDWAFLLEAAYAAIGKTVDIDPDELSLSMKRFKTRHKNAELVTKAIPALVAASIKHS